MPTASVLVSTDCAEIAGMLEGLARASLAQMRKRARLGKPALPDLYSSGIRYRRERRGNEKWQTAEVTAKLGCGDCEDLVAYLVAQCRARGEQANPACYSPRPGLIHCVVIRANGAKEDPSARLGMKGKG